MRTKIILSFIIVLLGLGVVMPQPMWRVNAQETSPAGQYAAINGLNLYYEVHGEGEPLILIHGGLGGIVEFSQVLPLLAETRQVIAVEMQGHGHTEDIDRPLSFEQLADDIAALIAELGYEKVDVMGFSLGGAVALRTAIQHPEVVNKLILISTAYKRSEIHAEFRAGMDAMSAEGAEFMLETPMYQFYSSVAPKLENWATLVGKVGELVREDYDWSEEATALTVPMLIVVGDSDFIPPSSALGLFELRGGSVAADFVGFPPAQFAVLPGTSHFNILYRTDLLMPVLTPFLNPPQTQ